MTLAQLLEEVRVELAEPTAAYWTDEQLTGYINLAARDFSVDTGILEAPPVKTDVIAGTAGYVLPPDCPGPQAVCNVFYDTDVELVPTSAVAIAKRDGQPHADTGTPTAWYAITHGGKNYIMLYPIPSRSLAGGLTLWYWKLAATLIDPDDVSEIPDEYSPGIVHGACARAYIAKKDAEQAAIYRAMYAERAAKAKAWVRALWVAGMKDTNARSARARAGY